ncbi:Zinc knuckle [Carex littledalei]|uniref:Zinc knuckle n=1 Tax=Carex littledalei TaxID=544730 RepID=A0A833RGI5_9POAL|nr:Zinc knuckle [Carex littledalei]
MHIFRVVAYNSITVLSLGTGMASLPTRLAATQATLQRIAKRQSTATTPTYAEIVAMGAAHQPPHLTHELRHPAFHQPTPHARPFNTTNDCTAETFIDDGWTTVTRKRRTRVPAQERKTAPAPNKHLSTLMAEGRCFKCLERGHTQFQCRNGVKCHNCHAIGHISRRCKETPKTPISALPAQKQHLPNTVTDQPNNTTTQHHTHTQMDLENWETAPMLNPDLIGPRAPELRVFFPPNDNIRSPNTLLHRSAVVLIGPRAATVNQFHGRVATAIATIFGCHPEEFKVETLDPSFGNLIVEFPSNILRNIAVHVGIFTIARGVDVQLRAWTPNLNMVRDPTTHQARITLHGVPAQYWNFPDVNHLISGFGYAVSMAPVITNGNYETLRVLIACYDPSTIPPSISVHKNPFSKTAYINIEGWVHNPPPSPSPPRFPDDEDQSSSNFGPHRATHRHRNPISTSVAGYDIRPACRGTRGIPHHHGGTDANHFHTLESTPSNTAPKQTPDTLPRGRPLDRATHVSPTPRDQQESAANLPSQPALPQAFSGKLEQAASDKKALISNCYRTWCSVVFSPFWHLPPVQQQKGGLTITEVEDFEDQQDHNTCQHQGSMAVTVSLGNGLPSTRPADASLTRAHKDCVPLALLETSGAPKQQEGLYSTGPATDISINGLTTIGPRNSQPPVAHNIWAPPDSPTDSESHNEPDAPFPFGPPH